MQDATTRFDVGDTVVINGATWQPEEPRRVEREAEGVDGAVVTQGVVTQPEMPTNDWRWTPGTEITPAMTAALQAAQEAVREEDPPNLRELAGIYEHTMGQPVPPPPQLNPNDDLERAIEDRYEEIAQDDEWEDDLEDDNEDDDY